MRKEVKGRRLTVELETWRKWMTRKEEGDGARQGIRRKRRNKEA